ncbi:MAG: flavin reductase family protein [Bacteroides sp.]|nr:flavin reductase family protein [Bacteroides sp.]
MRQNFGIKTWLYPMPVFIVAAYDANGVPNAMNAAWGGIHTDDMVGICLAEGHKTTQNILATKAFTVSMATAEQVVACDYVGIVSGNKEADKFAKAGFHAVKSAFVNAPIIEELPMTLECEFVSYDEETNHLIGKIVNVSVDDSVLGENGKIDLDKLQPITYDPCSHHYHVLGSKVGNAFADGKKLKG